MALRRALFAAVILFSLSIPWQNDAQSVKPADAPTPGGERGRVAVGETRPPEPQETPGERRAAYEVQRNIAIWTLWMCAFTGAIAVTALYQAWISRDTARRQLRAYVSVVGGTIDVTDPSAIPVAEIVVKNDGQTPAYDVAVLGRLELSSHPTPSLPPAVTGTDMERSKGILGPDCQTWNYFRLELPLTSQQRIDYHLIKLAFYVYGTITYRDVFHRRHVTQFKLGLNAVRAPLGSIQHVGFCEDGNDAD